MTKGFRLSEGVLLAIFPIFGVAVMAFHQLGRYVFYGIPLELFELDSAKIILSAAPFALYGLASLYSASILYNSAPPTSPPSTHRGLVHLVLAAFVTAPFWLRSIDLGLSPSWPTIVFVVFIALFTWGTEHFWKKLTSKGRLGLGSRIEALAGLSLAAGVLVLGAAFVHGAILAKDQASRTFISGTNLVVVLKSGEMLVAATYNPLTKQLESDAITLVPVSERTVLVSREAPID